MLRSISKLLVLKYRCVAVSGRFSRKRCNYQSRSQKFKFHCILPLFAAITNSTIEAEETSLTARYSTVTEFPQLPRLLELAVPKGSTSKQFHQLGVISPRHPLAAREGIQRYLWSQSPKEADVEFLERYVFLQLIHPHTKTKR